MKNLVQRERQSHASSDHEHLSTRASRPEKWINDSNAGNDLSVTQVFAEQFLRTVLLGSRAALPVQSARSQHACRQSRRTAESEAQGAADLFQSLGAQHRHAAAQMGLRHGDDVVQINGALALHSVRVGQADLGRHTPDGGGDRHHRDCGQVRYGARRDGYPLPAGLEVVGEVVRLSSRSRLHS